MEAKCVLVVDDDDLICWALEKELSPLGLVVHGVEAGSDALTRIRGSAYRLAFLDIELPDVNGLELLEPIHEASPQTRIVILSAAGSPENKRVAFARGAWQFIEKPFEIPDIVGVVSSTFGDYTEKRRDERYLCRLPLRVGVISNGSERPSLIGGTTVDVAAGGLRLETGYPLHVGQRVRPGRPRGPLREVRSSRSHSRGRLDPNDGERDHRGPAVPEVLVSCFRHSMTISASHPRR